MVDDENAVWLPEAVTIVPSCNFVKTDLTKLAFSATMTSTSASVFGVVVLHRAKKLTAEASLHRILPARWTDHGPFSSQQQHDGLRRSSLLHVLGNLQHNY